VQTVELQDNQSKPTPVIGTRLPYLDWLRFLVVLSLAPFHATLSFTGQGVAYVYDPPVRDAILHGTSPDAGPYAFRLFVLFLDNFFMHLLFFISGIGVSTALLKRSPRTFISERANRLLLPMLFGVLLVMPAQAWLKVLNFGRFSGNFFAFYPHFFNGIRTSAASQGNFDWGHLWFLVYLFVFSAIGLPLFIRAKERQWFSDGRLSSWFSIGARVLYPALWIGVLEAVFRPGWPGFQNLINDWANFTVYLSFFIFGYVAGLDRMLLDVMEKRKTIALAAGITLFVVRIEMLRMLEIPAGYSLLNITVQCIRGLAAFCLVLAAVGFGKRYLNLGGKALALARDNSFPLYIMHYLPLSAATLFLIGSPLPVAARWAIAVIAAWASVAVFTEVARRIPHLRSLFGIRKQLADGA
jgi:glucans biosynthesis protein C